MTTDPIDDRGQIVGTRITVYNLLPDLLDATKTEGLICRLYDLTPEQVAAGRAFVLNHADTVLAEHLRIEARLAAGNPPEVIERARQTRATLLKFKEWLARRDEVAACDDTAKSAADHGRNGPARIPTFREWLAEQESRPVTGS